MQQLSKREKTLLRVGVLVVILITLWLFGFLGAHPPLLY